MKKLIKFLSVALIGAMVIGCGGGGGNSTPTSGSLDKSFGDNGKVITSGTETEEIRKIISNSDGTIFVAGSTTGANATKKTDSFLAKYSESGTLVNSFGNNGVVLSNLDKPDMCFNMIKDSSGNIYVIGAYIDSSDKTRGYVAKYKHESGTLDSSFGINGFLGFPSINTIPKAITKQNGKIIVALAYQHKTIVIRLNSDGTFDNSFGNSGSITIGNGTNANLTTDIAIDNNNKIILVGTVVVGSGSNANLDMAIVRLTANGQLDTTFGTSGIATFNNNNHNDVAYAVKTTSNGKIIVAGYSKGSMALAKLNSNGTLDTSFGDNGVFFDHSGISSIAYDLTIDANDNILATGDISEASSTGKIAVWRFDTTGNLDTSFNNSGVATYSNDNTKNYNGYTIALDNNGKILVGGSSDQGAGQKYKVLLRINP